MKTIEPLPGESYEQLRERAIRLAFDTGEPIQAHARLSPPYDNVVVEGYWRSYARQRFVDGFLATLIGFILGFVCASLIGCTDEPEDPPQCSDLGCENAFCNRNGECTCTSEPGDEPIACVMEEVLPGVRPSP